MTDSIWKRNILGLLDEMVETTRLLREKGIEPRGAESKEAIAIVNRLIQTVASQTSVEASEEEREAVRKQIEQDHHKPASTWASGLADTGSK